MKEKKKFRIWLSVILNVVLALVIFYSSYVVVQNSLSMSLFGLFLMLFIGLIGDILDHRIKTKQHGMWTETILMLILVSGAIFVLGLFVFDFRLGSVLVYMIPYSLVTIILTYVHYQLKSN